MPVPLVVGAAAALAARVAAKKVAQEAAKKLAIKRAAAGVKVLKPGKKPLTRKDGTTSKPPSKPKATVRNGYKDPSGFSVNNKGQTNWSSASKTSKAKIKSGN